jgi:hypothetical protein
LDCNLPIEYNGADLLLLHRAYNHAPNALVPPPLTMVSNIDNVNKGHPAGWDGSEGGGHNNPPPPTGAIVIIIIVIEDRSGMGADDQPPPPLALGPWTTS